MDQLHRLSERELTRIKKREEKAFEKMICAGPECDKPLDPDIVRKHHDPYHITECAKRAYGLIDGSPQEDEERREKFGTGVGSKPYRIKK